MNIHQALSGIAQIRQQIDRAESYRGFRSATTAFSGVLAIVCGVLLSQTTIASEFFPSASAPSQFLIAWIAIACISITVACFEMLMRASRDDSGLVWRMHRNIAIQAVPTFAIGVMLTWLFADNSLVIVLPGVWAMIYGQVLIACVQHLPAASRWVAAYFIVGGIVAIIFFASTIEGLHLQMMTLFGVGQLALGCVLHWNMERASHA